MSNTWTGWSPVQRLARSLGLSYNLLAQLQLLEAVEKSSGLGALPPDLGLDSYTLLLVERREGARPANCEVLSLWEISTLHL